MPWNSDAMRGLFAAVAGVWLSVSGAVASPPLPLHVYTAMAATTAQAPLWGALADGWSPQRPVDVHFWKDLDDLRGHILAGHGDIWIGHLDGFAQAARRGAPVTVLAVTAWSRKFQFLSTAPDITTLDALLTRLSQGRSPLAVTPQGSPGFAVLEAYAAQTGQRLPTQPYAPQHIGLELGRGQIQHLLLPEPLATVYLQKFPQLRRIGSLADVPNLGGVPGLGLPLAGIAANRNWIHDNPQAAADLISAMHAWSARHRHDPTAITHVLPPETQAALGQDIVRLSLVHDPMVVQSSGTAETEIRHTLRLLDGPHAVAADFFWHGVTP